jgi:hypothetical protein
LWSCASLSSICIPASVEQLSLDCFYDCRWLLEVVFESGSRLSRLGDAAFWGCYSLSSICIPASVETIGENCFRECGCLSTVTFDSPSKLSSIRDSAFCQCSSLSAICISSSLSESLQTVLRAFQPLVKVLSG